MNNSLKVMVIEDEDLLLEAIGKKLQREAIDCVLCTGGKQALEHLNSDEQAPHVIWLDYYLKDTDGLSFIKALKENPKWVNIPVVVVSNSASSPKVNNMLAVGANKYLLKAEYRLEDIINVIKEVVQK